MYRPPQFGENKVIHTKFEDSNVSYIKLHKNPP